jgi:hypothetical protein
MSPTTFQIAVDFDRGHHGAQVRRHGRMEGEQLEAQIVDLDVQLVLPACRR